jgi:hypothetical protein
MAAVAATEASFQAFVSQNESSVLHGRFFVGCLPEVKDPEPAA